MDPISSRLPLRPTAPRPQPQEGQDHGGVPLVSRTCLIAKLPIVLTEVQAGSNVRGADDADPSAVAKGKESSEETTEESTEKTTEEDTDVSAEESTEDDTEENMERKRNAPLARTKPAVLGDPDSPLAIIRQNPKGTTLAELVKSGQIPLHKAVEIAKELDELDAARAAEKEAQKDREAASSG